MNEFSIPDETRRTSGGAALSNADAHVRPAEDVGELLATGSHSARPDVVSSMIPSDCGCGGAKKDCSCGCGGQKQSPPQKIFALGQIGYDFGSEARRDSIIQFLPKDTPLTTENLISALIDDGGVKPEAERIIWTLNVDQTPIYAIRPSGAFAFNGYAQIVAALAAQIGWSPPSDSGSKTKKSDDAKAKPAPVDLFSVAGVLSGEIRLMSGQTVPLLVPSARGVIAWDVEYSQKQLLKKLDADDPLAKMQKEDPSSFDKLFNTIMSDFKNIILRRYRNLGILGRERAINFASMTAFTVFEFLKEMIGLRLTVDDITVISSPACRPGSECYDVQIRAFRQSDITAAIRVFQFTLDVSDSIPVDIGRVATWSERPRG